MWLAARTARINTVRGLLREFGLIMPIGPTQVDLDVSLTDVAARNSFASLFLATS